MATKKKTEDSDSGPVNPATSASVYTKNGGHLRTYDLQTHGENFEALAKELAAQHDGSRIEVH